MWPESACSLQRLSRRHSPLHPNAGDPKPVDERVGLKIAKINLHLSDTPCHVGIDTRQACRRPTRFKTGHPRMPMPKEIRRAASLTSGPYLAHSAGDIRSDGAETVIAAIGILRASKMAAPTAFASGRF